MSHSTLYVFYDNGNAKAYWKFKNAFGSAARVWEALSKKYGRALHPEGPIPHMMDLWQEIWKVEDVVTLPWWEHNVLHWTFDKMLIQSQDVPTFIESLKTFKTELPSDGVVCHLTAVANALSTLLAEGEGFLAIGFQHTSVVDEAWQVLNQETEEYEPYNMLRSDLHSFVDMQKPEAVTSPAETPAPPS